MRVVEPDAQTHVVELAGELDIAGADYVRELICAIVGSTVVVDLRELQFMDVTGLTALLEARTQLTAGGHRLAVRGAHGLVRRVFHLTGFDAVLAE